MSWGCTALILRPYKKNDPTGAQLYQTKFQHTRGTLGTWKQSLAGHISTKIMSLLLGFVAFFINIHLLKKNV